MGRAVCGAVALALLLAGCEAVPGALSLDPLAAFGAAPAPAAPAPQGLAREADRPALDAILTTWQPPQAEA